MFLRTALLISAVFLMLAGAWIQWRSSWYQMGAEEDMKERKLTQDQVDRRLRIIRWSGCIYTLAGVAMLLASLLLAQN